MKGLGIIGWLRRINTVNTKVIWLCFIEDRGVVIWGVWSPLALRNDRGWSSTLGSWREVG
jgi:hypothetical protein